VSRAVRNGVTIGPLGEVMISQTLREHDRDACRRVDQALAQGGRQSKATAGYQSLPDATLCKRAFDVYAHLALVGSEERREEVERTYTALGEERFREGLPLSEVIQALAMTKYHLWAYVRDYGLLDSALQLYQPWSLQQRGALLRPRHLLHRDRLRARLGPGGAQVS